MIVTAELIRACGSGVDPTDKVCVAGYNYFVNYVKEKYPETLAFPTLKAWYDATLIEVNEERIALNHGLSHIEWVRNLGTNPIAIRLGGSCEETGIFRCNGLEFAGLEAVEIYKSSEIAKAQINPFDLVSTTKTTKVEGGSLMRPVAHRNQLKEADEIFMFNEKTGQHIPCPRGLEQITEFAVEKINAWPVFIQIKDVAEGYTAWEKIT